MLAQSEAEFEPTLPDPRESIPGFVPGTDPIDIPYADEELRLIALEPHQIAVSFFLQTLRVVESEAGLKLLSDNPVRYERIDDFGTKDYGPDVALSRRTGKERQFAGDLALVVEVVSTQDIRKEKKDMHFNKVLNEANRIPEFYLYFPNLEDERSLVLHRYADSAEGYAQVLPDASGRIYSRSVPGLVFRVLPRAEWTERTKIAVEFRGERLDDVLALRARLAERAAEVALEKARAEEEKARAEQEKARAEEEKARAEEEKARAEEEKARAEGEKARADRLAQRLRELGVLE